MKDQNNRRLVAIMFTDIVGYTALMEKDEKRAVLQRAKHRKVFQESHQQFDGEILQYYGDGTLSVFDSAVKACRCAIKIQNSLQEGDPVPLRIGLHLGDIVFDETEVYGEAVNLASRIESMGVAGSILLSKNLNDELKNKESIPTVSMGSFLFKNIEAPVEIYAITGSNITTPRITELKGKRNQRSIAVLPFVNMSADPENEFFSDGITEEIINALSKIRSLKVTSRRSSFFFKNKAYPIKKIAEQLDVTNILEGSVRVAGNIIRITAQLIEAEQDYHYWSESWDRNMDRIFETQDEISILIADKLREQFGHFEITDHLVDRQTKNLKTYELYLKGKYHLNKWNPTDTKSAVAFFSQAVSNDKLHAESYVGLADSYSFLGTTGFMPFDEAWAKAHENLLQAQKLNKNLPEVNYQISNEAFFIEGDFTKSFLEMKKAVESRPSFAQAHQFLSFLYIISGNKFESRKHINTALAIDPKSDETRFFEGYFYYMTGELEMSIRIMDECIQNNNKNVPAHSIKATALLCLSKYDEAIAYFDSIPKEVVIVEEMYGVKMLGHYLKGDEALCAKYFEKITELLSGHNMITASSFIFFYHVIKGEMDKAFDWLEVALENKSYVPLMRLADPLISPIRNDSRYELVKQRVFTYDNAAAHGTSKKKLLKAAAAEVAKGKLLNHLETNKSYLNPDITLRSLAAELGIPANQLSWLINEKFMKNFNDLINGYRIEYFKLLASDPSNSGITIMGLAYDSGFNSKTTFNTCFKRVTGKIPREYINSI